MTNKIQVVLVLGGVILVGAAAILWQSQQKKTVEKVSEELPTNKPTEKVEKILKFLTWEDGAGFKFEYPEGIKIDNHPEDEKNYANLTLTMAGETGAIEVLMTDNAYKSVGDWAAKDEAVKTGSAVDTTLEGKAAKKVLVSLEKTVVGIIDSEVLLTLTKNFKEGQVLTAAWDKIIDSFKFVYPTPVVKEGGGGSSDILEEE